MNAPAYKKRRMNNVKQWVHAPKLNHKIMKLFYEFQYQWNKKHKDSKIVNDETIAKFDRYFKDCMLDEDKNDWTDKYGLKETINLFENMKISEYEKKVVNNNKNKKNNQNKDEQKDDYVMYESDLGVITNDEYQSDVDNQYFVGMDDSDWIQDEEDEMDKKSDMTYKAAYLDGSRIFTYGGNTRRSIDGLPYYLADFSSTVCKQLYLIILYLYNLININRIIVFIVVTMNKRKYSHFAIFV